MFTRRFEIFEIFLFSYNFFVYFCKSTRIKTIDKLVYGPPDGSRVVHTERFLTNFLKYFTWSVEKSYLTSIFLYKIAYVVQQQNKVVSHQKMLNMFAFTRAGKYLKVTIKASATRELRHRRACVRNVCNLCMCVFTCNFLLRSDAYAPTRRVLKFVRGKCLC